MLRDPLLFICLLEATNSLVCLSPYATAACQSYNCSGEQSVGGVFVVEMLLSVILSISSLFISFSPSLNSAASPA
jgi:hypothetical protein